MNSHDKHTSTVSTFVERTQMSKKTIEAENPRYTTDVLETRSLVLSSGHD